LPSLETETAAWRQSTSVNSISLYEFGSSEETVRRIQKPFVQFFRNSAPILDIGCGRGIFLQLLAEAQIEGIGIDHSEEALAVCREKGLQVCGEDARIYLSAKSEKFGGIFCSHVIEHMGYDEALAFLGLCYQALRPGGRLVLITPNPEDICVISNCFWLDPTHVRPYPKLLLQAMLQATGFRVGLVKQFLGSWRLVGRRNIPSYLLRRLFMGRHFGKPNTLLLSEKASRAEKCL
jgi:2-polyprenyl-3-methyl-5-hydroxy-6-metoxy-1,4-benzoquinol methylase